MYILLTEYLCSDAVFDLSKRNLTEVDIKILESKQDFKIPHKRYFWKETLVKNLLVTVLIPSQELKFPRKSVASLDFYPKFNILI